MQLERNAEASEELLVTLEHPSPGVVAALVIPGNGRPDLVCGDGAFRRQQEREEVEDALDDLLHAALRVCGRSSEVKDPGRRSEPRP